MSIVSAVAGILAFLALTFLPGAWLTFGLRLPGMPFWDRLWIAAALTPLALILPFYVMMEIGVPFEWTTIGVVVLSLSGLLPILRRHMQIPLPSGRDAALMAATMLPAAVLFVLNAVPTQFVAFTGHAWLHTDIVYQLASGNLRPEEPGLAGIRMSYPWLAYVQQAMQAWVLGSSPTANYPWINGARLLVTVGLVWAIAGRLGGKFYAKLWAAILLLFGVNVVGYVLPSILPNGFVQSYQIWGDPRYTPWIRKFYFFNSMNAALAMFAAMLALVVDASVDEGSRDRQLLTVVLIAAIGIVYPLLFPAALAMVGGLALVQVIDSRRNGMAALSRLLAPFMVVAAGTAATALTVAWTTTDRGPGLVLGASEPYAVKVKAAESVVVLAPLLLGTLGALWIKRRDNAAGIAVLILTGMGSVALHAAFNILHYRNEYKYITTAAIALAPLAGLAAGSMVARVRSVAPAVTVLGALLLAAPGYHRRYAWDDSARAEPRLDASEFNLRLKASEQLAGALDAIRQQTPRDAVLAAEDFGVHLPTLTRRALYVPITNATYPGINITADGLLTDVRGYPRTLIAERRQTLLSLLAGSSDSRRDEALRRIRQLGRPIIVMATERGQSDLLRWLGSIPEASLLYRDRGVSVWLLSVEPRTGTEHLSPS